MANGADAPRENSEALKRSAVFPILPPVASMPSPPPFSLDVLSADVDPAKICRSPVIGIVIRIDAEAGSQVAAGAPLLQIESMKMENVIVAPTDGRIKAVRTAVGDAVRARQIVIEFE